MNQVEFIYYTCNYVQTNDEYETDLLVLNSNTWNHLDLSVLAMLETI